MILSWFDYQHASRLAKADVPFYALIAAAMIRADSDNVVKLRAAFPEVYADLDARYNAPAGLVGDEELTDRMRGLMESEWLVRA